MILSASSAAFTSHTVFTTNTRLHTPSQLPLKPAATVHGPGIPAMTERLSTYIFAPTTSAVLEVPTLTVAIDQPSPTLTNIMDPTPSAIDCVPTPFCPREIESYDSGICMSPAPEVSHWWEESYINPIIWMLAVYSVLSAGALIVLIVNGVLGWKLNVSVFSK